MNASGSEIREVDLSLAEDTLIVRPGAEVTVRAVPPGGVAFLSALLSGAPLGEAAAAGAASDRSFEIARNLAGLIDAGAVVESHIAEHGAVQ
jgi:hypothetical protein